MNASLLAGTIPTSLLQLRRLGYETNYWYGGSLANGNFGHFAPACGFDHAYSAIDIVIQKRRAPGLAFMTIFS